LAEAFNNINAWLLSLSLELSIPKTQFVVFNRLRKRSLPDRLVIGDYSISRLNSAKYLGIKLDAGLRWRDHIDFLKSKIAKYLNILKWLMGRGWGIDSLQAIHFINATILAQLTWGAIWYVNAAKNNLNIIENILVSAYKFALGLRRNSANGICWAYLGVPSFRRIITKFSDRLICKSYQLSRGKIINKIKLIEKKFITGKVARRNIPFLILRWPVIEPKLKFLSRFHIHPVFTYPFKNKFINLSIDLKSGGTAKNSNNPDSVFFQLVSEHTVSTDELDIFTNGSKIIDKDNKSRVGFAIYFPKQETIYKFSVNEMTSSYMAEVLAIDRVVDICSSGVWPVINICSDSLSFLQTLNCSSTSLVPASLGKLNQTVADLIYKINKVNNWELKIRFTWCPAHIGIKQNEKVNLLAKEASMTGTPFNNYITIMIVWFFLFFGPKRKYEEAWSATDDETSDC